MTFWDWLYDIMIGAWINEKMRQAGASPDALKGSVTMKVDLPAFGDPVAAEEDEKRRKIVEYMRSQLGKRYQFGIEIEPGNEARAEALDCSEAVEAAYRVAGLVIPDGAQFQYNACQGVKTPRPGDLGFLWSDKRNMIGHVMVYAGSGVLIHAVGGRGVVEDMTYTWESNPRWRGWRRHLDFARLPEDRA